MNKRDHTCHESYNKKKFSKTVAQFTACLLYPFRLQSQNWTQKQSFFPFFWFKVEVADPGGAPIFTFTQHNTKTPIKNF